MTQQGTGAYLKYYDDNKDQFPDEPYIGGRCLTPLIKAVQKKETTWDEINRSNEQRDIEWKEYHLNQAKILGFEIDADELREYFPRNLCGNFHVFE